MKNISLNIIMYVCSFFVLIQCNPESQKEIKNEEQIVNLYTHRHYPADQEIFERFTQETDIKVNVLSGSAEQLLQRLELEGDKSPADILMTVDGSRLYQAVNKRLLQAVDSKILQQNIPKKFTHPQNFWFGITYRGRVIIYAKDRVKPHDLSTYQDLTNKKWLNKILVRSSANVYNQSLLASLIAINGELNAKKWAESIVYNMAREPKGNDRDQIKGVAKGVADLAIANTYYLGLLANSEDSTERAVAKKVAIFFPNQEENQNGTHINISAAGITKNAPNKENAIKLLELLSSKEIQEKFASANYEYPVNPKAKWHPTLIQWGKFKTQQIDYNLLGKLNSNSIKIFNEVAWK